MQLQQFFAMLSVMPFALCFPAANFSEQPEILPRGNILSLVRTRPSATISIEPCDATTLLIQPDEASLNPPVCSIPESPGIPRFTLTPGPSPNCSTPIFNRTAISGFALVWRWMNGSGDDAQDTLMMKMNLGDLDLARSTNETGMLEFRAL